MEKLCPYERLASINDGQKLNELFKGCYENIKKWVKEDLFEKDYLLFPLNLPEHWSLLIAHKPILATEGGASIIYLDSFGIMDQKIITIIKMYLCLAFSGISTRSTARNSRTTPTTMSPQSSRFPLTNYSCRGKLTTSTAACFCSNTRSHF